MASNSGSRISRPCGRPGWTRSNATSLGDKGRWPGARAAYRRALRRGAAGVLDESPERLHEVHGLGAVVARGSRPRGATPRGCASSRFFCAAMASPRRHARRIHKMYGRDSLEPCAAILTSRAHYHRHRLSHRRRGGRKTRHPAQLDSARTRRDDLPARADGRRGPRLRAIRLPGASVRQRRSRWTRTGARGARRTGRKRRDRGRGRRWRADPVYLQAPA